MNAAKGLKTMALSHSTAAVSKGKVAMGAKPSWAKLAWNTPELT